jgi:hypothetical protein
MLAAADVGQSVVAGLLGLGAAGVAGAIVAMAWSVHIHQIQLARQLARREAAAPPDDAVVVHGANGNGTLAHVANGNGVPRPPDDAREPASRTGLAPPAPQAPQAPPASGAPPTAIEGPDSVVIGELARYRVRRSSTQQVVSWAAGGGSVSQTADPAHPDDLLLVAERPGNLTVSVRLREGLTERRETKAVTAVDNAEATGPPVTLRLFLQDWPLATVAVLVVGFAGALVALGSLAAADFVALVAPVAALLGVVATTRRSGSSGGGTTGRPAQ